MIFNMKTNVIWLYKMCLFVFILKITTGIFHIYHLIYENKCNLFILDVYIITYQISFSLELSSQVRYPTLSGDLDVISK